VRRAELRLLALLLLLELRDLARLTGDGLDDRGPLRLRREPLAAQVAARVVALPGRLEVGLDQPVGLGLERPDLLLAARDQRQRRRLHAAEADRAVERGAQPDAGGAGGVHPDHPVRLGARARRRLERLHLLARAQLLERLADRLLGHRGQPQPLDRLLDLGQVVEVGEDQLALAPGVAGVDDQLDLVVRHQLVDGLQLLRRALVVGDELELVRDDRQVGETPLLELRVVGVGLGQADQMADRPGDHVVVADQVRLVLRLREGSRQRRGQVARHGRLLCDD
jgi:hypothetical protein